MASKPEGGWEKAALLFVSARFDILLWTLFRRQVSQMRREGRGGTAELSGRFLRTQIACLPSPLPTNKRPPPPPPFTPLLRVRLLTESLAFLLQSDGEGRREEKDRESRPSPSENVRSPAGRRASGSNSKSRPGPVHSLLHLFRRRLTGGLNRKDIRRGAVPLLPAA